MTHFFLSIFSLLTDILNAGTYLPSIIIWAIIIKLLTVPLYAKIYKAIRNSETLKEKMLTIYQHHKRSGEYAGMKPRRCWLRRNTLLWEK